MSAAPAVEVFRGEKARPKERGDAAERLELEMERFFSKLAEEVPHFERIGLGAFLPACVTVRPDELGSAIGT